MTKKQCAQCGNTYNGEKYTVCPRCGSGRIQASESAEGPVNERLYD